MKKLYRIVTFPYLVIFTIITLIVFLPPMIGGMLKNKHEEKDIDENGEEKTTVFIDFNSHIDWLIQQPFMKVAGKIPKEIKVLISVFLWYVIFRII